MSEKTHTKTENFLEKVMPAINKFSNFKFIKIMQAGVVAPTTATIIGSIITVLMTPPFPKSFSNGFVDAWRTWATNNTSLLSLLYTLTIGAVALYTLLGISAAISQYEKRRPTTGLIMALMCFLIVATSADEKGGIITKYFGSAGLFTAILVGYFATVGTGYLEDHGLKIKFPDSVPPFVADALGSMFIGILIFTIAVLVRVIFGNFGVLLPQAINSLFSPLFSAVDSIWAVIIYVLIVRLLWFFGLHGGNIAGAIMSPFFIACLTANADAYTAGNAMPYIFNSSFKSLWTTMGMLPIAIALLLFAKSKQLKTIGKLGLVPAFFNIGEPLTFGLPIVLNFDIVLPYLGIFLLNGIVPYVLTKVGFLTKSFVNVPDTVPAIFKAYLINMDWRSIIVYLGLLLANVLIMMVPVKKYDAKLLEAEKNA